MSRLASKRARSTANPFFPSRRLVASNPENPAPAALREHGRICYPSAPSRCACPRGPGELGGDASQGLGPRMRALGRAQPGSGCKALEGLLSRV